jgi:D-glycero-D-manno-heptose 1,7-bisphosphate phosphatase
MYRAVFVRRDGIILHPTGDGANGCQGPLFYPGALDALGRLARAGLHVAIVVGAVGRCSVEVRVVEQAYRRMVEVVEGSGGHIAQVYRAAGYLGGATAWPQSLAGLLSSEAYKREIGLAGSYLVGDTATDIEAARALGCRACYLVLTGRGRQQLARCWLRGERGFHVAFDLSAAAEAIVEEERATVGEPVAVLLRETAAQ